MLDKLVNKHGQVIEGSENYEPKKTHLDLFKALAAQPDDTRGMKQALLILSTPRCGSTLFCEALNNTRQLGVADEWLNYEYFSAWAAVLDLNHFDLNEYMTWVSRKTMRNTGVLVINWHVGQIIAMNHDFGLGLQSIDFKKIVYLTRRDKIAQAVSLAKAIVTNQFRSYEEAEESPDKEGGLSLPSIAKSLYSITDFDGVVRTHFSKEIDYTWDYEDFRQLGSDTVPPHESYEIILREFGGVPQPCYSAGNLKKQGGDENAQAAARFLKYITGEPNEND